MLTKTKGAKMKTHIIHENGVIATIEEKITELKEMQKLVGGGYIEIVNAPITAQPSELPDAENCMEMVVNEEGLLRPDFGANPVARKIIAESFGCPVDEIQIIKGPVFVTDGWRID